MMLWLRHFESERLRITRGPGYRIVQHELPDVFNFSVVVSPVGSNYYNPKSFFHSFPNSNLDHVVDKDPENSHTNRNTKTKPHRTSTSPTTFPRQTPHIPSHSTFNLLISLLHSLHNVFLTSSSCRFPRPNNLPLSTSTLSLKVNCASIALSLWW